MSKPGEDRAADRAAFDQETADTAFTKDFNSALDALMSDPMATHGERVMAWIKRRAWGNYRLFAANKDGTPAYQSDCAADLGIRKQAVSAVVSYYVARGYLRCEGKVLYPVIAPQAVDSPSKVTRSPDFFEFLENWKVARSQDWAELVVARSTVERLRKVILSEYKRSRAASTKSAPPYRELREKPGENPKREKTLEAPTSEPAASPAPVSISENSLTGGRAESSEAICTTAAAEKPPARPPNSSHIENPTAKTEAPAPPGWHARLRDILKALPIATHLDEAMFQRIARPLNEELLEQFETAAKQATGIRKWAGYEGIAKQVAERGVVKAAAAANGTKYSPFIQDWIDKHNAKRST